MAIYHMNVKIGSRSKGQSAIAASAYRAGVKMTDEQTGLTSDYTKKSGIAFSEVSLCANAPAEYADREKLWNAVHKIEKAKNSQLWREIEVALPKEFSRDEQIATVREYVKGLTDRGMCADWSLHDKGDGNPHAHIMLTVRSILSDGSWASKSRKVYVLDENGNRIYQGKDKLGRRQYKSYKEDFNDWNDKERIEEWRSEWAECCNRRLPERDRIDHRSYVRQGVNQIPTIHEGYVARKRVRNGQQSDRVDINSDIRRQNAFIGDLSEEIRAIDREIAEIEQSIKKENENEKNEKLKKGSVSNAGRQRIAELLARRQRTIDSGVGGFERGATDGKRVAENGTQRVEPTETDRLIRQSEIERRASSSFTGLEKAKNREQELTSADTRKLIREADAVIGTTDINREIISGTRTRTNAVLRESETNITSATSNRREREIAEQRLRAEESRRIAEEERLRLEEDRRRKEKAKKRNDWSL